MPKPEDVEAVLDGLRELEENHDRKCSIKSNHV